MNKPRNPLDSLNFGRGPKKSEIHASSEKVETTPELEVGDVLILGSDPKDGMEFENATHLTKVADMEVGGLYRQAIMIARTKNGVRVRNLTDANNVIIWAVDQKDAPAAILQKNKPLGEEVWKRMGNHFGIDIETSAGVLRLEAAGPNGKFVPKLVEKTVLEDENSERNFERIA